MLCIVAWEEPEGRLPFSKFVSDFSMSKLIVVKVGRAPNLRFVSFAAGQAQGLQSSFASWVDQTRWFD